MGKKQEKTNAMRILDRQNIKYNHFFYHNTLLNAVDVANYLGKDAAGLFKTLVTVGKSGEFYVFMVHGQSELDLKKAALAADEKSIEMLPQKELLPLTGYVHGGCSPIGMKKQFPTFIDISAEAHETICLSGGRTGCQLELELADLQKVINITSADICR